MNWFKKKVSLLETKTIYLEDFNKYADVITYKCGHKSAQEFADRIILGNMIDYDGILIIDISTYNGISSSFLQNAFGYLKYILTVDELKRIKIISKNNDMLAFVATKYMLESEF